MARLLFQLKRSKKEEEKNWPRLNGVAIACNSDRSLESGAVDRLNLRKIRLPVVSTLVGLKVRRMRQIDDVI